MTVSTLVIIGIIVYLLFFSNLAKKMRAENIKEKAVTNYDSQNFDIAKIQRNKEKKESTYAKQQRIKKENEKKYMELVEEKFQDEKLNITQKFFTQKDSVVGFDDNKKKICFLENKAILYKGDLATVKLLPETYDYKYVFEAEVIIDEETIIKTSRSSQIGGAIVGAALLGGAGAVVGGLSGNKSSRQYTQKIQLKIILNNISSPIKSITFLNESKGVDKKDFKYIDAYKRAIEAHSLFTLIIKQTERKNNLSSPSEKSEKAESASYEKETSILTEKFNHSEVAGISHELNINNQSIDEKKSEVINEGKFDNYYSRADEITKLYNLLEKNIITKEEFETMKKRII